MRGEKAMVDKVDADSLGLCGILPKDQCDKIDLITSSAIESVNDGRLEMSCKGLPQMRQLSGYLSINECCVCLPKCTLRRQLYGL